MEKEKEISFDCMTEAQKMFEDADDGQLPALYILEDVLDKLIKVMYKDSTSGK